MRKASALAVAALAIVSAGTARNGGGRSPATPQANSSSAITECRVEPVAFDGWDAQQVTNRWLKLIVVPRLGGRLMQVSFAGHPFLFVNPKYRGRYFPASENARTWFNYGGDKIWPMPEGTQDEQHWPGPISDPLDDGDYAFHVISQGAECRVRLEGPADARTGLQYTREIGVDADSPQISFRATMKNASNHPIRWSVQSVTQYDTADAQNAHEYNRNFWAFTPANERSSYVEGYHVRAGLAEDPAYAVRDGMFTLHWSYLQGEVWVDSPAGWLAVVDGASQFAMVERFHFDAAAEYPGKASVIFYKNGPAIGFDADGKALIRTGSEDAPFYMEAEVNSPMVRMAAGESYTFETEWFPTRMSSDFKTATDAGVIGEALRASGVATRLELSGTFGVFFAGRMVARLADGQGKEVALVPLGAVDPAEMVKLHQTIEAPAAARSVTISLVDERGRDRGAVGGASITRGKGL